MINFEDFMMLESLNLKCDSTYDSLFLSKSNFLESSLWEFAKKFSFLESALSKMLWASLEQKMCVLKGGFIPKTYQGLNLISPGELIWLIYF